MHQPPHFFSYGGQCGCANNLVERLGGSQVMRDRADAAQPLHHHRNFPIGPALDKFFESAEFDYMQTRLLNHIILIEQQSDLAMALYARERVNRYPAEVARITRSGFKFETHALLPSTQQLSIDVSEIQVARMKDFHNSPFREGCLNKLRGIQIEQGKSE